ncbi:Lysine methyltransferase [Trinorchestia longiramus]|nr:Lysine methyltransferase [Trinorchestia longiramus]
MEEMQEKYLCMYPVEDIKFERLFPPELTYSSCCERQQDLLQATLACDTARRFPAKVSYTKRFLKSLIQQIEQQGHEVLEEFYTSYTDLLAGSGERLPGTRVGGEADDVNFYRTYSLWGGGRVTLRETSNVVAEGTTGLCTWQAAHVLLRHLLMNPSIIEGKRVVELGAGVGLLGLGVVLRGLPVRYTFTDVHPAVLESLQHNIALNLAGGDGEFNCHEASEWEYGDCLVRLASVDWQCEGSVRAVADCDVVLAADVVFDPSLFDALLKTLGILLRATEAADLPEPELAVAAAGVGEVVVGDEVVVGVGVVVGVVAVVCGQGGCGGCPPSPSSSQRLAIFAVTIRNEENYKHFLDCIAEHDLQLRSVQDIIYREAPCRREHTVKLLYVTTARS